MLSIAQTASVIQYILMDFAPRPGGYNRWLSYRVLKYVAPAMAALALSGIRPSSSTGDAFHLEGAGINSSAGLVADPTIAQAEMTKLNELGGDTVEISIPYTQGGVDVINDQLDICNVVNAAVSAGKDIVLRDQDHFRNGDLGYVPSSATQLFHLYTRDIALVETLVGPNGCAKGLKNIYYSPGNELNNPSPQFNPDQADAPEQFVNLYRYLNHLLPKEAAERGLKLQIVIGELAQRNAVTFLTDVKQIMISEGLTGSMLGSVNSIHYYFNGGDANSAQSADNYLKVVKTALNDTFGSMDSWVTEAGEISTVPTSMLGRYTPLPSSIKPVSPEQQGKDISSFMFDAAKRGFTMVLNEQMQDDGTNLRTGLIYNDSLSVTDGTEKASFEIVQNAIKQLVSQK